MERDLDQDANQATISRKQQRMEPLNRQDMVLEYQGKRGLTTY